MTNKTTLAVDSKGLTDSSPLAAEPRAQRLYNSGKRLTHHQIAERNEDIACRRAAGQGPTEIARAHGLSRERVRQILDRWLLPEEKPEVDAAFRRARAARVEEMRRLRAAGASYGEIGQALGVSRQRVAAALRVNREPRAEALR